MPPPPTRTFQPTASYNPPSSISSPTLEARAPPHELSTPTPRLYCGRAYLDELERRKSVHGRRDAPAPPPVSTRTERAEVGWRTVAATRVDDNASSETSLVLSATSVVGVTSLATTAASTTAEVVTLTATPALQLEHLLPSFPDWPPLLVYFLAMLMLVMWGVGVLLYFATFPNAIDRLRAWRKYLPWRWLGRTRRGKRGDGYVELPNLDEEIGVDGRCSRERGGQGVGCGAESATSTAHEMHGLGITTSTSHTSLPSPGLRRRRSLDVESDRSANMLYEPLTAPLPSSHSFTSLTTRSRHSDSDLESGTQTPVRYRGPVQHQHEASERKERRVKALLESVNAGIEWVAWKVARAAHDQVNGAEEGLLLGVRDRERGRRGRPEGM